MEVTTQTEPKTEVTTEGQQPNGATPEPQKKPEINIDDIDDATALALLEKKTGRKVKSWDELKAEPPKPSKEESEAAEKAEKDEALNWAITTKIIDRDKYDKAIVAKGKKAREIALEQFSEQFKDDKNVSPSEIEEMFKEFYFEDAEEGSLKFKEGQKRIEKEAKEYLAQYKDVDDITDKYRQAKTVGAKLELFKKETKDVAESLPKEFEYDIDGDVIKVPMDEKILKEVIKDFTGWDMFYKYDLENQSPNKNKIVKDLTKVLKAEHSEIAIKTVAKEYANAKVQKLEAEYKGFQMPKKNTQTIPIPPVEGRKNNDAQRAKEYAQRVNGSRI